MKIIVTKLESVKRGWTDYDSAKSTILKWMNFGLSEGKLHDMKKYFQPGIWNKMEDNETPVWVGEEYRKDVWNALEFFDLI